MRRIKLSPAMVVAVVALVMALGGGAIAGVAVTSLNKHDRKKVKRIAKRQANRAVGRIPDTTFFAFVKQDGTLLYGDGATGATRTGQGSYSVGFDRDIAECAPFAVPGIHGRTDGNFSGNSGAIDADAFVANDNGSSMHVTTRVSSSQTDTSFYAGVLCP
jgi:hypothetical protein